jgi:EAL domain-containing protein (putative c-di-GMP-specific phosphodiesterase class I)
VLFTPARAVGRVAELDWVCRAAAFDAFHELGLPTSISLFVNTEPEGFAAECPPDLMRAVSRAETLLRVFVEVNNEATAGDPAGVLAAVDRARAMRWGICIDDVGGSQVPGAMLPVLQADLVKLDLGLLQQASPEDAAAVVTSVLRHVEQAGASLLIERIESEADAAWARSLGAAYGQGRFLGAPGDLAETYLPPSQPIPLVDVVATDLELTSPFAPFADGRNRRISAGHLERLLALIAASPHGGETWPVFLLGLGSETRDAGSVAENVLGHARRALLAVAFATSVATQPCAGVRGVRLPRGDALAEERFLVVLTDQVAVAVVARRAPDGLYDVVVTQDQDRVNAIAHHLIRRIPGRDAPDHTVLPPRTRERDAEPLPGPRPARVVRKPGWQRWLGI